jgi:hypothetical protein
MVLYALSALNFVAFVVFSFIFVRNILKLRREREERQLGSKIKTRLLVYFISISFLPITAMAVFSYLFLNRSIEKWMGRLPENVVERVREQQRETSPCRTKNSARPRRCWPQLERGRQRNGKWLWINYQPRAVWPRLRSCLTAAGAGRAQPPVAESHKEELTRS